MMFMLAVSFVLLIQSCDSISINSTGGTAPTRFLHEAIFTYKVQNPTIDITYGGIGSTPGKCNMMGYWNTLNVNNIGVTAAQKTLGTYICSDTCTVATCGYTSASNPRANHRQPPLIDFGETDGVLSAADYLAYPDLQLLPALGSGLVPVYNIPELVGTNESVILTRQTVASIFLGEIKYWNDTRILSSNNGIVKSVLSKLHHMIHPVVISVSAGLFSHLCRYTKFCECISFI